MNCRNNDAFKKLMGDRTFGELHNIEMDFSDPSGVGPFKRALAFQVGKLECAGYDSLPAQQLISALA